MCVVVYKPKGIDLPSEKRLRACFNSNPDGAGYMFPDGDNVCIKKGFMTFDDFYNNLIEDYFKNDGDEIDFVMHFRIGTHGGINKQCCHPFPLSKNMFDLYKTECRASIGVAHNGIISLTGNYRNNYDMSYSGYTYSDTMQFITDYLSLIIKDEKDLDDESNIELIEKLIGYSNKIVIMTPKKTKMIGSFSELDGVYYSNLLFVGREDYDYSKYKDWDLKLSDDDGYNLYEGLEDMSFSPHCGKACACRKCINFEDCYGMPMPVEWDKLSDEEIDEEIDAMFGGYYDT